MKPYVRIGVRNRTLMEGYGLLESYRRAIPGTACQIQKALDVGEGYAVSLCYEIEDRKRIRLLMEQEIREGRYTQKFFDDIDATYKNILKKIKSFPATNFSVITNEKLSDYFDTFDQIYVTTIHPMVLAIYASDLHNLFEKELYSALNKEASQEKVMDYTALLLTPTQLTTVQKEEQLLFELQDTFEKNHPDKNKESYLEFTHKPKIKEKFGVLSNSFGWFHMEYIGEPRTLDEYQKQIWDRIDDLQKVDALWKDQRSPQQLLAETTKQQNDFFAAYPASKLFKNLVFAMQEFLIVLDFSKADLIEGLYYARPLLSEISKRVGLDSWIDVRFLLPDELRSLLRNNKKTYPEYIRDRKKHWACLLEHGKITTYFGSDATEIAERLVEQDIPLDVKEFKGIGAYPGKVRGIASVITSAKDKDKFKQGQILVTRDTTTELTSVIKKSIAIVADQGGLLSHTAIVAREFKIPCLVLTKIGTKVIHDGDELEVDANKGIVRVVKAI